MPIIATPTDRKIRNNYNRTNNEPQENVSCGFVCYGNDRSEGIIDIRTEGGGHFVWKIMPVAHKFVGQLDYDADSIIEHVGSSFTTTGGRSMYISLNTLILIVVLIVSIMTVPYSIVITVLFIHGKFEYKILNDEYHELEEAAEDVLKKVRGEAEESKKKKAKRGPVGFAVTNEPDKSAEKAEPDGKEVAQA